MSVVLTQHFSFGGWWQCTNLMKWNISSVLARVFDRLLIMSVTVSQNRIIKPHFKLSGVNHFRTPETGRYWAGRRPGLLSQHWGRGWGVRRAWATTVKYVSTKNTKIRLAWCGGTCNPSCLWGLRSGDRLNPEAAVRADIIHCTPVRWQKLHFLKKEEKERLNWLKEHNKLKIIQWAYGKI